MKWVDGIVYSLHGYRYAFIYWFIDCNIVYSGSSLKPPGATTLTENFFNDIPTLWIEVGKVKNTKAHIYLDYSLHMATSTTIS